MAQAFRVYDLSIQLYHRITALSLSGHLRVQCLRAAASICQNLREGSGRRTDPDRARFYRIALASQREVGAIFHMEPPRDQSLLDLHDHVGACIFKACRTLESR
jgi:four helix bundle protein